MEKDQEFVAYIVKALVDNPDKVIVDKKIDERGVLLTLTVDPADMGKVIGRQGATAKALRKLLAVFGAQSDARISLQIAEPEGSERVQTVADVASDDSYGSTDSSSTESSADDSGEENPTSIL